MTVIVYGPQACGKTRSSAKLAAHFGVSVIVDDWDPRLHALVPGALHLTCILPKVSRFVRFETIDLSSTRDAAFKRIAPQNKRWPAPAPRDQLYRDRTTHLGDHS